MRFPFPKRKEHVTGEPNCIWRRLRVRAARPRSLWVSCMRVSLPLSASQARAAGVRECRECGAFQTLPDLKSDSLVQCVRCQSRLRRARRDPVSWPLALTITGLALYLLAISTPLLGIEVAGRTQGMSMLSGPIQLDDHGTWELAIVVFATILVFPFAKLAMMLAVLLGLRLRRPWPFLPLLFAWVERISQWAMIEVFLLGGFVAYTRLSAMATVDLGTAAYALGALMLVIVALDASLDCEAIWDEIGDLLPRRAADPPNALARSVPAGLIGCDVCRLVSSAPENAPCPRCHAPLRHRKPNSINRTWALTAAAAVLYLPANLYPIMTITYLGRANPATIIGGMKELAAAGMWPLAALVFVASIMIPLLKLVALVTLLVSTQRSSPDRLRDRTRLYKSIEVIGRWSMIDVFMVTILVALLRLGILSSVEPGAGAVAFASVVVLTMLATVSFDPRLIWDRACANGPVPSAPGGSAERLRSVSHGLPRPA